jgi:hypothetical protein
MKIVRDESGRPWYYMGDEQTHLVVDDDGHQIAFGKNAAEAAVKAGLELSAKDSRVRAARRRLDEITNRVMTEIAHKLLVEFEESQK